MANNVLLTIVYDSLTYIYILLGPSSHFYEAQSATDNSSI